jgi:hypothetical protein
MERNDLLKTIGFSDDFIQKLDEYENKGVIQFEEMNQIILLFTNHLISTLKDK